MNRIYMSIMISYWSNPKLTPDCIFYEAVDGGKMTRRELTLDEARKLQWELVKAGATRTFSTNMFNPKIAQVDVNYWALH